jgi:hypothetical protein
MKKVWNFLLIYAVLILLSSGANSAISLELKDTDVITAIDSLFKGSGKSYSIASGSVGRIPKLSISDVEFDQALKLICQTAGLSYKMDDIIYVISPKPVSQPNIVIQTPVIVKPVVIVKPKVEIEKFTLMYAGPQEIIDYIYGRNN